jgi:hypothetical protein
MERKITKDDVWGKWSDDLKLIDRGMIVAKGYPPSLDKSPAAAAELFDRIKVGDTCPVWKDKLPYKSVTVICDKKDMNEVMYWLEYVHGGDCVEKTKDLPGDKVAIRSNYMCW